MLPDNASILCIKSVLFCFPVLSGIAVATLEVCPAVLLFVAEVCEVLRV